GKAASTVDKCYFEHIPSGEIIPLVDVEYAPLLTHKNNVTILHGDFAVVKLQRPAPKAKAIPKEDFFIEDKEDLSAPVKVISNYAANDKDGTPEALTMTTCK